MDTSLVKYMINFRYIKVFSSATLLILLGLSVLMQSPNTYSAERIGNKTLLPLPRFVSLRTEPANMRKGPGTNFPVVWVYKRKYLPVEVIEEFDSWRQVIDPGGSEGWIHQSILSGKRTGLIKRSDVSLHKGSTISSSVLAKLTVNVIVLLERCPKNTDFCFLKVGNLKGWVLREEIWGIYEGEHIN